VQGNYTVTLTVTDNDGGTNTVQKSIVVHSNPPVADFSYTIENLTLVNFTDKSTDNGTIVNWTWNFGDGSTSYEQNPVHNYSTADEFNVTLTVTDNDGLVNSKTVTIDLSGKQSNWFHFHLPLSITAIIVIVGLVAMGAAFVAYFMKPEIRSKVGIVASLATMFSILWIVMAIILYYADVPIAYLAADIMLLAVTLILTVRYYFGRRR